MNLISPFLTVAGSADATAQRLRRRLSPLGLRVLQTFDLNDARHAAAECPCPHHGQAACDCEMLVLLIYSDAGTPVTLILHGNDGHTWLSLVDKPAQQAHPSLQAAIENALQTYAT